MIPNITGRDKVGRARDASPLFFPVLFISLVYLPLFLLHDPPDYSPQWWSVKWVFVVSVDNQAEKQQQQQQNKPKNRNIDV